MICKFLRSASSISSSAWADVAVKGFSTKTCLSFSSAFLASSWCVDTGVTMATASISGDLMTSSGSDVARTPGWRLSA